MTYKDSDDGHRIDLADDNVIAHAKQVFEQGLQLEAILLAHEYLEQKLNNAYKLVNVSQQHTIHKKFKPLLDLLKSEHRIFDDDYYILNEFNRLRNVNSHQILDFSLKLKGAKKGDMIKTMNLAEECDQIISKLSEKFSKRQREKGKQKGQRK